MYGVQWATYHAAHMDKQRKQGNMAWTVEDLFNKTLAGITNLPRKRDGSISNESAAFHKRPRASSPAPTLQTLAAGASNSEVQTPDEPSHESHANLPPNPSPMQTTASDALNSEVQTPEEPAARWDFHDAPTEPPYSPTLSELTPLPSDGEDQRESYKKSRGLLGSMVDLFRKLRADVSLLIAGRAGIEFPQSAKSVTWTCGIKTVLPWTKKAVNGIGVSPTKIHSVCYISSTH